MFSGTEILNCIPKGFAGLKGDGRRRMSEITNQYLINFAEENIILRANQGHMYQTVDERGDADTFVRIDIEDTSHVRVAPSMA